MNISEEKIGYRKGGELNYELVRILKEGGVVGMRTDTVYGLLTPAFHRASVEELYRIKMRSEGKPFIILISGFEMLKRFPIEIHSHTLRLLEGVWPGEVSVVLPLKGGYIESEEFYYLHQGKKSLAFRVPNDSFLRKVISLVGPLVALSANAEGEKPAQSIQEVIEYFGDTLSFYEDGGVCDDTSVSRIISFLEGEEGKYLR